MRNDREWEQWDSDILAHFIQVHAQISRSRWHRSNTSFAMKGNVLVEADFPPMEDFVFAATYFRQLTLKKDDLLNDAITNRYLRFLDCPIRRAWMQAEVDGFNDKLDGNVFLIGPTDKTVRELFDAFLYGAGLVHKAPHPKNPNRSRFLEIYDTEQRAPLLYALNMSLRQLLNHVSRLAVVVYQDLSSWTEKHKLPLPDVRWHDRLFNVPLGDRCELPLQTGKRAESDASPG